MGGWWRDLGAGLRAHRNAPVVTLVVILTLTLGIATSAASFSLLNGLLLRPLPVARPSEIVRIYSRYASGSQYFTLSYPDFVDIAGLTDVFAGVVAEEIVPHNLGLPGSTERVVGEAVAGGYFEVLGLRPAAGRFFSREEAAARGRDARTSGVVVIGHALWLRRFGGASDAVGRTVTVNGHPALIIGVAPRGFHGVTLGVRPELWRPASRDPAADRGGRGFFGAARLRAGVSVDQAAAALDILARRLQEAYPSTNRGIGFSVLAESESRVHPMARDSALGWSTVLVTVAGLVLLVACANVAGVLLVRATSRRADVGIRLALGASRGRIVRQLLVESGMLVLVAGAAGLMLAVTAMRSLGAIDLPTRVPLWVDLGLDVRVLAFGVTISVVTALLSGLAPALESRRADLVTLLKDGAVSAGVRPSRLRGALVASQVAVALVLLMGGGLFLRSLEHARQVDLGFDPHGVVAASADLGLQGYSPDEATAFCRRLLARLSAQPGVSDVSLASTVPFELNITRISIGPQGYRPPPDDGWPSIDWAAVGADYFATMRIPLMEGREFNELDTAGSPQVVVVNDVLARRFWPGEDPVGRSLTAPGGETWRVVGVAGSVKHLTLGEEPAPFVYFSWPQRAGSAVTVLVRAEGDPAAWLREIRQTVRTMDAELPLYNLSTLADRVDVALLPAKSGAAAVGAIALFALLLASLGLYATVAQTVACRAREIGVRRALGARRRDVLTLVVGQAMRYALGGLAAGVPLALAGSRALGGLLYGVAPTDPAALSAAPAVVLVIAATAAAVPALRAIRINAAAALRRE